MLSEFAEFDGKPPIIRNEERQLIVIEETGGFIDASGNWIDVQYRGVIGPDKTETTTTLIAGTHSPDSIPSQESTPNLEAHAREVCFLVGLLQEDEHGVLRELGYNGKATNKGTITRYSLTTPASSYAGKISRGISLECGTEAAYYALIIAKYCPFDQTKSLDYHRKHWNNWLEALIDNRTPISSGRYLVNVLTEGEKYDIKKYLTQVADFFEVESTYSSNYSSD